ncbi:unnamed protein product [Rhizoctonia solani]|uniref:Uncharacterized protein n=1 Tax=Rhizoctonia solani TaxID=456999 RepID=A0A8H3CP06_9AGAM|nr:unnamed protein product [Rhizoctonia solani]
MSRPNVGLAIGIIEAQSDTLDRSDARLEALGYRPEFRREMNLFAVVGMSFTAIGILTGMSSAFQTGMKSDKPVLGYVTGVLYACAMIFTGTSGNLSTALYIASMAEVGTGITLTRVQITAMAWGVNLLSAIINTLGSRGIGTVAQVNVWWTLVGTVILVVTLLVKSPVKNSAAFVFTDLENFTGWGNNGFVVLLGFLQAVYTLEGAETSAQVAEEARNAEWLAPIGIAASIVGSWFIGLIYLLALLFSIQSIPSVQNTSFAIPIAQLYYDAVGSRLTLLCLFVVGSCQFLAACSLGGSLAERDGKYVIL